MAKIMALFGSQTAKDALATNRDYARPRAARGTIVHTQINLDGKKIATAVTKHQANAAGHAPQSTGSGFNSLMHISPAGGY
jgi:hypothetical protein